MHEGGICIINYPNFICPELQQYEGLWELYSQLKQKRYWIPRNVFKRGPYCMWSSKVKQAFPFFR